MSEISLPGYLTKP